MSVCRCPCGCVVFDRTQPICRSCEAGYCADLPARDEALIREVAARERVSARKAIEIIARQLAKSAG